MTPVKQLNSCLTTKYYKYLYIFCIKFSDIDVTYNTNYHKFMTISL